MISGVTSSTFSVNQFIAAFGNVGAKGCSDCADSSPQTKLDETEEVLRNGPVGKSELTEEEQQQVKELERRDAEVRRHEQAHKTAAGSISTSGPTFEYQSGPDGQQYAIGGEVQIDTSEVPNDPQATIQKMQQVRRAAMAPAEPSSQDRQVAAKAAQMEQQARAELREQQTGEDTDGESPETDAINNSEGANNSETAPAAASNDAPSIFEFKLGGTSDEAEQSTNPASFVAGSVTAQAADAPRSANTNQPSRLAEYNALLSFQRSDSPGRFINVAV